MFRFFKRRRNVEPTPFASQFLPATFFGEPEQGCVGIVKEEGANFIRGITVNPVDRIVISEALNAGHASLNVFPLVCLPMQDSDGKYLFIEKIIDPTHFQYQEWGIEPGPPGAVLLKLDDADVSRLDEQGFEFAEIPKGLREKFAS